jgi:hypothetical protein
MLRYLVCAVEVMAGAQSTYSHEIYTGLHGRGGQLCCGANDCSAAIYREHGEVFEFLTRENIWVEISKDRITFLPVPGDTRSGDPHRAHLCS